MALSDPHQITIVLQEMCADSLPIALMSRDLLVVHHGRFSALRDDALVLEFSEAPDGISFSPPAFCIASFNHKSRPHLFTTRVKLNRTGPGMSPALVEVEVPAAMRWPESRKAVRLAVNPDAPLIVAIRVATREIDARALDISLCGALVELTGHAPPVLQAGERVLFMVESEGRGLELTAIVRRVDGARYGLYFPDAVTEGRLDPPRAWRHLVETLARNS